MKKLLFLLAINFIVIGFFLLFLFVIKNDIIQYKTHTAYITSWSPEALETHPPFTYLNELLNEKAPAYQLSYTPHPLQPDLKENDFHLINRFYFLNPKPQDKERSYLWQVESPFKIDINPKTHEKNFKKIFTYFKSKTNGKNIIYLPIPYDYPTPLNTNYFQKTVLLAQVATYYTKRPKYCIYHLRNEIVQWMLETHPTDIIFCGNYWDGLKRKLSSQTQKHFDTQYQGYCADKFSTISKAKFALAFENATFPDYVTEKIFDVMTAGTVPIYAGAPNITNYVPKECFIDYNNFKSPKELYQFISKMPKEEYFSYINCINKFLEKPEKHANHWKNVTHTLFKHLKLDQTVIDKEKTFQVFIKKIKNIFQDLKN